MLASIIEFFASAYDKPDHMTHEEWAEVMSFAMRF